MGQKLTVKEQMRRNSRAVKKAIREVEREHKALERAQKKLVTDIKKLAKQGQMNAVKIISNLLANTGNNWLFKPINIIIKMIITG